MAVPVNGAGDAPDIGKVYASLLATGGSVFTLYPQESAIRIYAFRGGKAVALGHNHVLSAPRFVGFFYLAPPGAGASRFDLRFRLDELEFDDPQHRAALGPAFATPLAADAIASTRKNMLGDNNFQAAQFPFVHIRSNQIVGDGTKYAAKIGVDMHGQSRDMWVPLSVTGLPEQLTVEGALVLRQTDFGVKPFSVLNGLLAIQDEVLVEFKLSGATGLRAVP